MHCRARPQRDITGVNQIEWGTKSSVYGRGEASMFGSAGAIQLSIYNKTEQAKATDKLDYWEGVWDAVTASTTMTRRTTSLRMYGALSFVTTIPWSSNSLLAPSTLPPARPSKQTPMSRLQGTWMACGVAACLSPPGYFDPLWTLMRNDARVDLPVDSPVETTEYKRHYKTARGFSGKNLELFLGNFVSLLVRERVSAKKAFST